MSELTLIRPRDTSPVPPTPGLVAADGTTPLTSPPSTQSAPPTTPVPAPAPEQPAHAAAKSSSDDTPEAPGMAPAEPKAPGSRVRWLLVAVVVLGALVIAAIGFVGSYSAVRDLAEAKGFGDFAPYFPIGIDAGIVVLLALDLLLTWLRIGFPLLRQTAWLLTGATVAFNAAAAWPDALGAGMHAVIPVLFIVAVEAARHAVGRVANLTAGTHMDGVRASRWLLAFPSTFRLWRRMKLWELRDYSTVVAIEQDWAVYREQLRARYGRRWRRKAPAHSRIPLRLARYGIPLDDALSRVPAPDAHGEGPAAESPDAPAPNAPAREADAAKRTASGRGSDAPASDASAADPDAEPSSAPGASAEAPGAPASRARRPRVRRVSPTHRSGAAAKPPSDDERRARLRQLAASGQAPASIRQAADVLGCRQQRAKQLLADEGLLPTTTPATK